MAYIDAICTLRRYKNEAEDRPVAIIFGGRGYEREISLRGAHKLVADVARKAPVLPIFIDAGGEWGICLSAVCGGEISTEQEALAPTFPMRMGGRCGFAFEGGVIEVRHAFVLLHGDLGEDGVVQGALVNAGIRLWGTDGISGAVCSDKAYTKWIAASLGIPVLPAVVADRAAAKCTADAICSAAEARFGYPVFVKPCRLGSSIGAAGATCREELCRALDAALSLSPRVMIEPMLEDKRELECAYLSVGGKATVGGPGEIILDGTYTFDEKYSAAARAVPVPTARVNKKITATLHSWVRRLAIALGISGIARFDFFCSGGKLYFNEINTVPGMTPASLYTAMLESCGISRDELAAYIAGGTV